MSNYALYIMPHVLALPLWRELGGLYLGKYMRYFC